MSNRCLDEVMKLVLIFSLTISTFGGTDYQVYESEDSNGYQERRQLLQYEYVSYIPGCNPQFQDCSGGDVSSFVQDWLPVYQSMRANASEGCVDEAPGDAPFNCSQYVALNLCPAILPQHCRKSCGACVQIEFEGYIEFGDGNCMDELFAGIADCSIVVEQNLCNSDFILNGNYCQSSCGQCTTAVSEVSEVSPISEVVAPLLEPTLFTSGLCEDIAPINATFGCDQYAEFELCSGIQEIYCQKSCNRCPSESCQDLSISDGINCSQIVELNGCYTSRIQCPLSCGLCPKQEIPQEEPGPPQLEDCDDISLGGGPFNCSTYAQLGLCSTLPLQNCKKSCNKCLQSTSCEDVLLPGTQNCHLIVETGLCEDDSIKGIFCAKSCDQCDLIIGLG